MNHDLEKVREIFLANDVDDETRADNERQIAEWERDLRESEALAEWRESDITKKIAAQARATYRDVSMQLALNRTLTDEQRRVFWAKQDACLFIISITEPNAKDRLQQIHLEIKTVLNGTN